MKRFIEIYENKINMVFCVVNEEKIYLIHLSEEKFNCDVIDDNQIDWFPLVELQYSGEDQDDHHGSKYTGTLPGKRLVFSKISDERNSFGRVILVILNDKITNSKVKVSYQFYDNIQAIESLVEVINCGDNVIGISYVSSFVLNGLTKHTKKLWDEAALLKIPTNGWFGEFQWQDFTPKDLGLRRVAQYSTNRISISSSGTWNSHEHLPMGYVENKETSEGWYFSIIHNGSWHYEFSDMKGNLYLQASGPTENENHWYKELKGHESFKSVPVAVAITSGGFERAVCEMTKYRRCVRRKNSDNIELPIIFNDFMNCLGGDPTVEKLLPLIDVASEMGCEYFTIDAGWYADGPWWTKVGQWYPAKKRFPNGIEDVISYIRKKGMIPGLWLEIEVMGKDSEFANSLPDDFFFIRHGKRVIDHGRYQLDFRNPNVIDFANSVIKRLMLEYKVGYIKMDYNINAGIGTEIDADSFGHGLLLHNRAYLKWIDSLFETYPNIIIENCSSGGMRINDALLRRHSIQSCTDQDKYLMNASISAASPSCVTPEQNAVWSYPLIDGDLEEVAFNMINAMTMRIHQSGHLYKLKSEKRNLIKEAFDYYKSYRHLIPKSYPFWPIGIPHFNDDIIALGFKNEECAHIAVWRISSEKEEIIIPLSNLNKKINSVSLVYPKDLPCKFNFNDARNALIIRQPNKSARLFRLKFN